MTKTQRAELDYNRPVEIATGIYWVGFNDVAAGLHCNPYLIIDGEEAVLIDGGSRPDFPTVMMKILETGLRPSQIKALVYQHYDPDLCGSMPNFEDIIQDPGLRIISSVPNQMFIRHYSNTTEFVSLTELGHKFMFSSGRTLTFINTPYAHAAGSFVTFDEKTKTLFSSDLFGSFGKAWTLYLTLRDKCGICRPMEPCPDDGVPCSVLDFYAFHQHNFPSGECLRYALSRLEGLPFERIAPQHGSILEGKTAHIVFDRLKVLENVGIEQYLSGSVT